MNVSAFSKLTGLSPHTVRYYDKIGLFDDVHRRANGHRSFAEKDVLWLAFIQRLKDTGMPLSKILEYAQLRKRGSDTLHVRQKMLIDHASELKHKIASQQAHLEKLDEKVAIYQSALDNKIDID